MTHDKGFPQFPKTYLIEKCRSNLHGGCYDMFAISEILEILEIQVTLPVLFGCMVSWVWARVWMWLGLGPGLWGGVARMCVCMVIKGVYCFVCVRVVACFCFNFTKRGTMHEVVAI